MSGATVVRVRVLELVPHPLELREVRHPVALADVGQWLGPRDPCVQWLGPRDPPSLAPGDGPRGPGRAEWAPLRGAHEQVPRISRWEDLGQGPAMGAPMATGADVPGAALGANGADIHSRDGR